MHGLHFNHYFCTDHSNATEEKKAPRHVLLWQCDIIVFAAVQLLPSPVISKELDVLLAMVAALRSELDEVQLYSNCIFIRCNHLLISSLQTFGLSRLTVFRIAHSSNLMGVIDIDGNGMSTYRYTQNWNHIIQDYINVNMHTGARTHIIYTPKIAHI